MKLLLLIIGSLIFLFAIFSLVTVMGCFFGISVPNISNFFSSHSCDCRCLRNVAIVSTIVGIVLICFGASRDKTS